MKPRILPALVATACALATFAPCRPAEAAGFYFGDRGVRPLSRGGAFVAGADDLGAGWYNPAGIAYAGTSLLADFSYMNWRSDFTRETLVVDGEGNRRVFRSPLVNGSAPFLPLPTLGASYAFGREKEFTIAFILNSPYTPVANYPLTQNGAPASSRYSLVTLEGSLLALPGAYFAWKPSEAFAVGAGLVALTGSFRSQVVFSASPSDRLLSAPEDPNYDALSELKVGPIVAPTATLGFTIKPTRRVTIGLSGILPIWVNAPATIRVKLPTASPFDDARQEGQDATVRFQLPGVARLGVEFRPFDPLRIELGYAREFWGIHQSIDIAPKNIQIYGLTGLPSPFAVSPITLPRGFKDSNSVRLGAELTLPARKNAVSLRAGVSFEESGIKREYVSPLTIDLDKVTAAGGASFHLGDHWRFDVVYAHVFGFDEYVSPDEAKVPRVNPVKGNPTATESVNGGRYAAAADVIGVGGVYRF
ncbi:MAG: outer membrane protein transport protein [Polyangiaceae bacterium]